MTRRSLLRIESAWIRRGRLRGFPPQLAHQGEVEAGFDALHVGEDHGRDVQAGIEAVGRWTDRAYACRFGAAWSSCGGGSVKVVACSSLFLFTFRQVPQIRKVVFCFGNRALGTHRHNSSRVDRDMSHALASPSLFRLSARAVVPKRARTRRFAARAGGHPAPIGFPHPPPTIHVMKISPPEPDHK